MNQKIMENAHKVTYLVHKYPDKPFKTVFDAKGAEVTQGLVDLLAMPAIDINAAIWLAQEYNWIGMPDPKTDIMPLLDLPTKWNFGQVQTDLQEAILYAFGTLAKKETDLEEIPVSQWLAGYSTHDMCIALAYLLETKKLAEYSIEDDGNNYVFYTLYANRDQLWGRKQFKTDPLADTRKKK